MIYGNWFQSLLDFVGENPILFGIIVIVFMALLYGLNRLFRVH